MAATTQSAVSAHTSTTPSPTSRRPRSKHQNSFLIFENASVSPNRPADGLSKAAIAEHFPEGEHEQDADNIATLLDRLVTIPLLSISFILSLFLVERSERARRSSEHPSQHAPSDRSFWSTFTLQNWLDPEPYQDPDDITWQDADSTQRGCPPQPKRRQWFMQKKHRRVSKVQISDAFEIRGRVMVALLALSAVALVGFAWIASKAYRGLVTRLY